MFKIILGERIPLYLRFIQCNKSLVNLWQFSFEICLVTFFVQIC